MDTAMKRLLIGTAIVGAVVVVGSCTVAMMSSSNNSSSAPNGDWNDGTRGTVVVPQQTQPVPPVIIYRDNDTRTQQSNTAEQALLVMKCTTSPDFYHWNQWACQRAGVMTSPNARRDDEDRYDRAERQRRQDEIARMERQRRVEAENALAAERRNTRVQIEAAAAAAAATARQRQQAQDRAPVVVAPPARAPETQVPAKPSATFNNTLDGGRANMTVKPMVIPDTKSYVPTPAPARAPAPAENRYDKYRRLDDPNCCGKAAALAPAKPKADFFQKSGSGYASQTMTFNKPTAITAAPKPITAAPPPPKAAPAPAPAPKR